MCRLRWAYRLTEEGSTLLARQAGRGLVYPLVAGGSSLGIAPAAPDPRQISFRREMPLGVISSYSGSTVSPAFLSGEGDISTAERHRARLP